MCVGPGGAATAAYHAAAVPVMARLVVAFWRRRLCGLGSCVQQGFLPALHKYTLTHSAVLAAKPGFSTCIQYSVSRFLLV